MWWSEHISHTSDANRWWLIVVIPGVLLWLRFGKHNR